MSERKIQKIEELQEKNQELCEQVEILKRVIDEKLSQFVSSVEHLIARRKLSEDEKMWVLEQRRQVNSDDEREFVRIFYTRCYMKFMPDCEERRQEIEKLSRSE